MYTDNPYLNRADVSIERLLREKKWARVVIAFAALGIFAGVSAAITFYFQYKLILITSLALISAVIAGVVVYVHVQFLRDVWQIWTYQLKYWSWAGFGLQAVFCMGIFVLIALGLYHRQSLTVDSYYVASVWSFMCWKWSFTLFYRSRKYRSMFTRYSLIGVDGETSDG